MVYALVYAPIFTNVCPGVCKYRSFGYSYAVK